MNWRALDRGRRNRGRGHRARLLVLLLSACATPASAQSAGAPGAASAPGAAGTAALHAEATAQEPVAAKTLFGAVKTGSAQPPKAIGFYSRGCLAGAAALPIDGPAWQVMRLSRNRNWGHPALIAWLETFAREMRTRGWPGLLVGDIAQPRGGPMVSGHASHQVGLDADIWLTPMPDRRLTETEREELSATSMLAPEGLSVDQKVWTSHHVELIRHAAQSPQIERVLVHPAIKKALCAAAAGDRGWLTKVRPYWGHHYHMHLRIGCPADSIECKGQPPPPDGDGCGKEVDDWLKLVTRPVKAPSTPTPPPKPITLDQLPQSCRLVLQ